MTSDAVHRYLVAYDVVEDRRRTRIARLLESYGDRLQYSVFLVDAKPAKLVRLRERMGGMLDLDEDAALICDLGHPRRTDPPRIVFVGRSRLVTGGGPLIV